MQGPFERLVGNYLEELLSSDYNAAQAQQERSLRFLLEQVYAARVADDNATGAPAPTGFIGDAFRARPTSPLGNSILLRRGLGLQYAAQVGTDLVTQVPGFLANTSGVADLSPYHPLVLLNDEVIALDAPPAQPNNRVDLIEVRYRRSAADNQQRKQLNPPGRNKVTVGMNKTVSPVMDGLTQRFTAAQDSTSPIAYKVGVAGANPVVPPTTPGYQAIANILVRNVAVNPGATITDTAIIDLRPYLFPHGIGEAYARVVSTTGALIPASVTSVNAPPGVQIASVARGVTGARTDVYVIFGSSRALNADVSIQSAPAAGAPGFILPQWSIINRTISAQDQIDLGGLLASPQPTLVTIGQPVSVVSLRATTQNNGASDDAPAALGALVLYHLSLKLLRR